MTDAMERMCALFEDAAVDAAQAHGNAAESTGAKSTNKSGNEENKQSRKNLAFRKKSSYNEYTTLATQWAYNTKRVSGDTTILYDGRRKKYVLLEAMEEGYFEASVGDYKKVSEAYEQAYGGATHTVHEDTYKFRANQRPSVWDMQLPQDGGNGAGNARSFGRERLQNDARGNDEHLLQGNQGKYVEDSAKKKLSRRNYSYDALISKPDMTITVLNDVVPSNRADIVAMAKKNAAKIGKFDAKTGAVSVHVDDIDSDIILGTRGLKHGLDRRFSINALVTLQAGSVLKNSIQINELTAQKKEADSSYVLIGVATEGNGKLYVVRSVVNKFSNVLESMDVLYAINAKKGDLAVLNAPEVSKPLTSPTVSISNLLDFVNQYFPDILPEDVLKHYGYTERPDGDLGKDALYSIRNKSNREILADALETTIDTSTQDGQNEAKLLEQYKEHNK